MIARLELLETKNRYWRRLKTFESASRGEVSHREKSVQRVHGVSLIIWSRLIKVLSFRADSLPDNLLFGNPMHRRPARCYRQESRGLCGVHTECYRGQCPQICLLDTGADVISIVSPGTPWGTRVRICPTGIPVVGWCSWTPLAEAE